MSADVDWLSRFLAVVSVSGRLEIRCAYRAPWIVNSEVSSSGEVPYHLLLRGTAWVEGPQGEAVELHAGDAVLFPHGSAHVLRDGSGLPPARTRERQTPNVVLSENDGTGERLDMLCGRFAIAAPHDRWLRSYLPSTLVVRTGGEGNTHDADSAARHLAALVELMRAESTDGRPGGYAILNALSAALFALVLRVASQSDAPPPGLLALAAHPRLAPAISAMLAEPARAWTLPELAALCNMSRATFMRRFQEGLGKSASELLQDIRMSLAANELKNPVRSTEAVAEAVGYQSVAAFRRVFTQTIGMAPGAWRRQFRTGAEAPAAHA
ncbi:cupin domain-containing protein [Luteibacter jiangsuensis]